MKTLITSAGRYNLHRIVVLSLIIGLAACGSGGSSGGGSGGGVTLPTAPVTITQANSSQVAGVAIDTLYGGATLPTGVQSSVSTLTPSAATSAKTLAKIGETAAHQIVSGSFPATVTGAVSTSNCVISGTQTVTTSSTSGTATYSNCVNTAGETLNGTMTLSNITSTVSYLSTDAVFNLTVTTTSPANTLTVNGDMHLYIDAYTITMSGTRLSMGNTNSTLGNLGMLNYTMSFDITGTFTTLTFTFASTVINGTADFTMTTMLVTTVGSLFPSSGTATITGANSTILKLTVLGDELAPLGSQVKLELSTDGGIIYSAPTYQNWANISSRI